MSEPTPPSDADVELAERLVAAWDEGRGTSKSQLEIDTWADATSHGRHFDRFIRSTLGMGTTRPSKQTNRIEALEEQIRGLGGMPRGTDAPLWEAQTQHARASCLEAIRVWNDPVTRFRTGAFSLMFVTAWNSLAIALIERAGGQWRKTDSTGKPTEDKRGLEQAKDTLDLIAGAFPGEERRGLRANVEFWVDIRNAVAHRYLPALDGPVIPNAQAGLLNFEGALVDELGIEYRIAESLTVPLQLSGFRDPGVLSSRKKMQEALPLDVQILLTRAETSDPGLLSDRTFQLRVAFVPVVPASGRNPDAISYFVKPGEVPTELADALDKYVVLPKVGMSGRPNFSATHVISEVQRRTGYKLNTHLHAESARRLGARPLRGDDDKTVNLRFAEYISSFKRYLYSQAWIDELAEQLKTAESFETATGKAPVPVTVPGTS